MIEVKVPSVGESVEEGLVGEWQVSDGDIVAVDDVLLELETDKATVDVVSEAAGKISIKASQGTEVKVGDVLAIIDPSAAGEASKAAPSKEEKPGQDSKPAPESNTSANGQGGASAPSSSAHTSPSARADKKMAPSVKAMVGRGEVSDINKIEGTGRGGRVTKSDVIDFNEGRQQKGEGNASSPSSAPSSTSSATNQGGGERNEWREPMTMLRRRIAQRLVDSQKTAAILTTFNEIDMGPVKALRGKYKEKFKERHGVNLGFMSFFVKASVMALQRFPRINGWIDGNEIVYHDYCDVGVAVSTPKGLMVPVIRNAQELTFQGIEQEIMNYAEKARSNKITVDDLSGGTFTVSNGGVFGSLMSTPILNPPQSGILGMHKIQDRPMAVDGKVEIRPMMYVALSYDHRIVDGAEAVGFLVTIKECIEDPTRLLLDV